MTAVAPLIVAVHRPVPLHPPPQPVNVDPVAGVSESVTIVLCANEALHVVGQLMPAGLLVTVPEPDSVTVSCGVVD